MFDRESRSIRAIGQRYRIIYQVLEDQVLVVVVALGRRKDGDRQDVYELASKLVTVFQLEQFVEDENPLNDDRLSAIAFFRSA